ncbi:MAG TPA: hypothetical protein VJ184_08950 [Chryseolinea sp.]|nr:hypothetical protein [Chryseolinea sp.]
MTKGDLKNIKEELSRLNRFNKLLAKLDEGSPSADSFVFEALFAYETEKSDLNFQYEININPTNDTTVDFVYEEIGNYKLCCELLSPDMSDTLKQATEPQDTDIEGIKTWEVLLEGNHQNEHLRPQAQTIRLQEKLLEKVVKFPVPIANVFCTIVVDCTKFHFGLFDPDDCRMVMYGKTKVPESQEFWDDSPILGLPNPSLTKNYAEDFRNKITAVIFIPKLEANLLSNGFLILNHHRSHPHLQDFWTTLRLYAVFHSLKCLPFPA